MNRLVRIKALLAEWGFNIEYNNYSVEELNAVIMRLKLKNKYNIPELVKELTRCGIIRLIDIDNCVSEDMLGAETSF